MSNTDTDPNFGPQGDQGIQVSPPPGYKNPDPGIQQPQQPRALPPAIGNFLGNIGAFVPPGTSPTQEQGRPPPQWPPPFTPNRRQMYVPAQANRPTTDLGKPARFPQQPDMWQVPGIYEGVGRQLGRWGGSQRTRLMAGNLSRFTNAYMQGSRSGQREYTRIQHQRMTEAADALQGQMQTELQTYGAAYNSYSNNPNALHTDLMNRATQLGDTEMQAALNLGPREAERLLQWRQAKYDDLSRGNTARKEHDEYLRARNPFMMNPVGPDGLPAERLPLPAGLDPHGFSMGERWQPPKSYPQNYPGSGELRGAGGRLGAPEPLRPRPPMTWPSQPPDARDEAYGGEPDEEGYPTPEHPSRGDKPRPIEPETVQPKIPTKPPTKIDPDKGPSTDEEFEEQEQRDKLGPDEQQRRYEREQQQYLKDQGQERAQADRPVRLAQADTGTMSDAVTLPQITVKPDDEKADEEDPTDVWDRVEINKRAREARERGRTGDQPSVQPTGQTGAQPPAPDQAQQRPGAQGQRGQGGPAGTANQTNDPNAAPAAAQAKPPAKAPAPGVSATVDAARAAGQDPDFIEGFAAQWAIGQQTTSGMSRSGIPAKEREAIFRRGTEIRNKMFEVINDPNTKEGDKAAVLAAIDKQNPQIGAEIRGILDGSVTPRRDSPYWVYQLAHKADPSITQTTFKSRADTLKEHTTGKAGQNRIKLGTAVLHGDDLLNELETIGKPGGVSSGDIFLEEHMPNILAGKIMPDTSAAVGRLNRAAETFAREYNAVMSYTGPGSMTERKEMKLELDPQNPRKAIADVRKALDELKVRNAELKHNFEVGWGGNYDAVMKNYDPAKAFPESAEGLRRLDQGGSGQQGGVIDFRDLH